MFDKLADIIVNYVEVNREDIKPESRFMEDLGFTTFDFMRMLCCLLYTSPSPRDRG